MKYFFTGSCETFYHDILRSNCECLTIHVNLIIETQWVLVKNLLSVNPDHMK